MKSLLVKTTVLAVALALPIAAYSQGRHDEKPHASQKPAETSTARPAATGGRHDSGVTTHGPGKVAKKKNQHDELKTK
jgi:hypothetical protein